MIPTNSGLESKKSAGLKALEPWQALVFPIILMVVGCYTWGKDRIVAPQSG